MVGGVLVSAAEFLMHQVKSECQAEELSGSGENKVGVI
jgi:hypothetical protein